ncbi:MAG: hypothetical protein H0T42_24040 [Deltaproteobacteria bacterium]|nr:hypothetical protein [Deltaproteobacteria bacterium]
MRLAALFILIVTTIAHAAPPEPSGPHPRMLLDKELKAAWKNQAQEERGPVVGAIALCTSGQSSAHDRALYQGAEWSRVLQACLVAWAATDDPQHAKTAIKFFSALLDDKERIGDAMGGDTAVQRDSGYVIRNIGPYTALAYDWLHGAPGMTPALRQHARERWAAWLRWYRDKGYRARVPGSNYQAGFLAAATMIAIAQGGEAAEQSGDKLWAFVADELWAKDMAAAFATNGVLDGGDWPEGWQYGPLAVAHYSLAARIARRAGIKIDGVEAWLASVLRRHVHGLSPGERVYVGQDTEHEQANIAPHVLTLNAVALGDASPDDRKWARGELARLKLVDKDYFLYDALAGVGDRAARPPRAEWPTWYATAATGTVFARTRWDERGVWLVAECPRGIEVDHRHPKAGNFVLSRGVDDVIVDPSPYGSASTLTSNAPAVASALLPADYTPSQGPWSKTVTWSWATQTRSGVVALRCDYADAFRFKEKDSDVAMAIRDLVLLPDQGGTDAALVVIDRATTGVAERGMNLRFRVAGGLALEGELGSKTVGATKLTITSIAKTSGRPVIGRTAHSKCYTKGIPKGTCDAARFEASDYRLDLTGPEPSAAHVIGVGDVAGKPIASTPLSGKGWTGVRITSPREAVVVWPTGTTLSYQAPPGTHVILDAPQAAGMATVTAKREGDTCSVSVTPGGTTPARPAILTLDAACAVVVDPASASTATAAGTKPPPIRSSGARTQRSGCCGAQTTPSSPIALAVIVMGIVVRRRRK